MIFQKKQTIVLCVVGWALNTCKKRHETFNIKFLKLPLLLLGRISTVNYFYRYDIVLMSTFMLTFITWLWSYIDVHIYNHEYLPRSMWPMWDPTLLGEGLFAIATILAFGKLLYHFQIGRGLGPMQVVKSFLISSTSQ